MPGTMLKNLSLFCVIAISTLVAEHVFFAVSDVAAQAKPQRLVPVQIPLGTEEPGNTKPYCSS